MSLTSGTIQCRARPLTAELGHIGQVGGQCSVSISRMLLCILVSNANAHSRATPTLGRTLCVAEMTSLPVRYLRFRPASLRPRDPFLLLLFSSPFFMFSATGEHPYACSPLASLQQHALLHQQLQSLDSGWFEGYVCLKFMARPKPHPTLCYHSSSSK
jgi:hypothetical protein